MAVDEAGTRASTRIRLARGVPAAALTVLCAAVAVRAAVDPEPGGGMKPALVLGAIALAAAWFAVRAARMAVVLGPDAVVVRNPLRTYRVPYREIARVDEGWVDLLSRTQQHIVGSRVVTLSVPDRWSSEVSVEATAWLPPRDFADCRAALTARVKAHRSERVVDPDTDRRPPYAAVLRLLEDADPEGLVADGDADTYELEADELATLLRSRRLTADDVTELFRDLYGDESPLGADDAAAALAARLNAL